MLEHVRYRGFLRPSGQRGHIVAHDVSWAVQTGKHLLCPGLKFVSATNVARVGKRGNIFVGNNVSATMCPRLPGPLTPINDNR